MRVDFLYYDRGRIFASTAYAIDGSLLPKLGIRLNGPTASDQVNHQDNDCNHQQKMDQSTAHVTDESQQPQN